MTVTEAATNGNHPTTVLPAPAPPPPTEVLARVRAEADTARPAGEVVADLVAQFFRLIGFLIGWVAHAIVFCAAAVRVGYRDGRARAAGTPPATEEPTTGRDSVTL